MSEPDEFRERIERVRKAGEYPSLTPGLLNGFTDDDLENELFNFICKQKIAESFEQALEIVRGLSAGLRAVYATFLLQMEVDNGGFNQFFWNQDPDPADPLCPDASGGVRGLLRVVVSGY